MKTVFLAIIMVMCIPAMAIGGQWEGSIQGLSCAMHGKVCPTGMEDPYIAVEDNFVLYTGEDSWFLLPNINKGVMIRYLNEPVRVLGTKNSNHPAINVNEFQVKKDGEWQTIWSEKMEEDVQKLIETWGM